MLRRFDTLYLARATNPVGAGDRRRMGVVVFRVAVADLGLSVLGILLASQGTLPVALVVAEASGLVASGLGVYSALFPSVRVARGFRGALVVQLVAVMLVRADRAILLVTALSKACQPPYMGAGCSRIFPAFLRLYVVATFVIVASLFFVAIAVADAFALALAEESARAAFQTTEGDGAVPRVLIPHTQRVISVQTVE